jgi:peptidyl-prolyl cis-trans isomerase C
MVLFLALLLPPMTLSFSPSPGNNCHNKPSFFRSQIATQRYNLLDSLGSMIQNFGKKARASHILIAPRDWDSEEEARQRLIRLKEEINNDPVKFAEAATRISSCPSSKKGGDLGDFGPGMMVRNFDKVCFNEDVGVVHGPISTQFGEHLILITERTGEN